MAEYRLNRLAAQTGAPNDFDRLVSIPADAFTSSGEDAAREAAARDNPPETWTFARLRTYFQQGISSGGATTFVALTDTPAALGSAGQYLRVGSGGALEFGALPASGDANVQSDWNEADSASHAFIRNKPTIPTLRTAAETVSLLEGLTGNARLDAGAIKNLPEPQGGGLTSVHTGSTLSGLGTQASPLNVANPFTAADETKLDGIEPNATADQTGAEMVTAISALTGNARLNYSALQGAPTTITQAQADKLAGIETGATADQTGAQMVTAIAGLTGTSRLSYNALRDTPTWRNIYQSTEQQINNTIGSRSGTLRYDLPLSSTVNVVFTGTTLDAYSVAAVVFASPARPFSTRALVHIDGSDQYTLWFRHEENGRTSFFIASSGFPRVYVNAIEILD